MEKTDDEEIQVMQNSKRYEQRYNRNPEGPSGGQQTDLPAWNQGFL